MSRLHGTRSLMAWVGSQQDARKELDSTLTWDLAEYPPSLLVDHTPRLGVRLRSLVRNNATLPRALSITEADAEPDTVLSPTSPILGPLGLNSPSIAQRHALHVERTAARCLARDSGPDLVLLASP